VTTGGDRPRADTLEVMRRREWLRLVGVGAASLASGCGDDLPPPPASVVAAVLEPTDDGFVVSIFDEEEEAVALVVRDARGEVVTEQRVELAPSGVAIVTGLSPASTYEVTVTQRARAPVGPMRVRTAPAPDDERPVRIAVSADFDPHPLFESAIVDHVIAADPDLFVSIGDFPYCDNGPPVVQDVPGYRLRHYQARSSKALSALHANVGVRSIYDDHEFRNDWNPVLVEREASRYAAAMQVWDEFFPLRVTDGEVRYRSWRYGAHLECFLLDCRRFRSSPAEPDTILKTMLGARQRQWLQDGVRASTASFKLILSSVPLNFGIGVDHWKGFTTEREALLDALVGVPGVLFVSGDQHYFASHRHSHGVREFQVGPFARGIGPYGDELPGVLFRAARYNVGLFDVDKDTLRVTGLGSDGERFYEETFTPELLRPA
jgi:phosphodiesterase/alkaline phosphatase D-like protein